MNFSELATLIDTDYENSDDYIRKNSFLPSDAKELEDNKKYYLHQDNRLIVEMGFPNRGSSHIANAFVCPTLKDYAFAMSNVGKSNKVFLMCDKSVDQDKIDMLHQPSKF